MGRVRDKSRALSKNSTGRSQGELQDLLVAGEAGRAPMTWGLRNEDT